MSTLISRTAKSAKGKLALTLLGVLAVLGSAAVYAAKAKPDFKLAAAPQSRSLQAGGSATYTVKVKRIKGFKSPVTLGVRGLPGGTTAKFKSAPSCRKGRGRKCPKNKPNVLGSKVSTATLTLTTSPGTPVGTSKPTLTAKGGGRSHTSALALVVQGVPTFPTGNNTGSGGNVGGGGTSAAPPQIGTFALGATPATRNVPQTDSTTFTVNIDRSGGFTGPVSLGVSDSASPELTPTFSPGSTINGSTATMNVEVPQDATLGTHTLTITASGTGTATRTTTVTVNVQPNVFAISGDIGTLAPGDSKPVDVQIQNPYDFTLVVNDLTADLTTDNAHSTGCAIADNFVVHMNTTFPINVPANSTKTLTGADRPVVEMKNLSTSQDACKGAPLTLTYTGDASK